MRIAIVNTLPVPSGNASVNRFLGYGKELVKLGVEVDVITSAHCENCRIDSVNIISCGKNSLLYALWRITQLIRRGKYDAVILVSNSLLLIYPVWGACKLSGAKCLQEKSEYPFVIMNKGWLHRLFAKLYVNTTYRLFDGMIVMTKPLLDYFKTKVRKGCRLFEMPMTVDTDRFDIEPKQNEIGDYFAYCGNMSNKKDGIINLLDSFVPVERKFSNVKLVLIGGTTDIEYLSYLKQRVKDNHLKNVIFYGGVPREEIPSLLINARGLLLARPSSLQSSGGFPTKLGEYLSTGKPIVVTAVGDIPLYLNDDNSFIVPPDDNNAFSSAILTILENYDNAIQRGVLGRRLALSVFSSKVQSKRLYSYLQSII
jgi:glycosyltransferase involved in cell wall biosynthesis